MRSTTRSLVLQYVGGKEMLGELTLGLFAFYKYKNAITSYQFCE